TLPTITKTGYTCGWSTNQSATNYTYNSGASFTPSANTVLYGICKANTYTITLNNNGGTGGSSSTTATYDATTLAAITNPTRANTTGTRTVSGFTNTPSGTNATITYQSTGNCTSASNCASTNTTTYTFNGWYKEAAATNKIANNSTTPALQANTDYTNSSSQWTSTSNQTLYAGWTANEGSYASITLPTITRTGSTCGWATSSTATTWTYNSGASITPASNLTLYGVCRNDITLNNYGASTRGSTSTTVDYGSTNLSSITVPQRRYTASGFTRNASAANSTVSSTNTLTNNATFDGWYTASSGGTKIAGTGTSPALEASTTYTNSLSQWTYTTAGSITLYSQWTDYSVVLPTITRTGSTCGWSLSDTATNWAFTSGSSFTPTSNYVFYGVCKNNITLDRNGGTSGSTSTTVNYNATSLNTITAPTRSHTLSGFYTAYNNASGATVSSTSSLTATYTFDGWYDSSSGGTKIAGTGTSPALEASTTYTNSLSQWTYTTASDVTLHAHWSGGSVTLPTIAKNGFNCGWTTSSSSSVITYNSGASITPSSSMPLYGVCVPNTYSLYINFAGNGVSSVQVRTASGTGGTLKGTVSSSGGYVSGLSYNTAYYLYPSFSSGYEFDSWAKTSGQGTLSSTTASNPSFTIGIGNGTVTVTGKKSCSTVTFSGYMQDLSSSTVAGACIGSTGTMKDKRDDKQYTVAKLNDGKLWMTTNLNIAGGTALTYDKTDFPSSYSIPTDNNWQSGGKLPASSTSGFNTDNYAYVYNSGQTNCNGTDACYSYYSWEAATLGSGRTITTLNDNAPYSICPKNWHLPTTYSGTDSSTDFKALTIAYGGNASYQSYTSSTNPTAGTLINNIGASIPNFGFTGDIEWNTFQPSTTGRYWSSSTYSNNTYSLALTFYQGSPIDQYKPGTTNPRRRGTAIRCVFSQ
ncbi:InlB B-repeat-containing protein, partial [Candidatus Saccharibacteria bacterium]|nr:InlB B-repeat-containing protein [Candidatus Saccharibacteria bacterium]